MSENIYGKSPKPIPEGSIVISLKNLNERIDILYKTVDEHIGKISPVIRSEPEAPYPIDKNESKVIKSELSNEVDRMVSRIIGITHKIERITTLVEL